MANAGGNKELVRTYVERFNGGDIDGLRDLFTADAMIQGVLGSVPIEAGLGIWRELHDGYAIELEIVDLCAEGTTVVARYTERGRSRASFRGEPVTGETHRVDAMEWFQMRDGKISARWGARDNLAVRRQLKLPL